MPEKMKKVKISKGQWFQERLVPHNTQKTTVADAIHETVHADTHELVQRRFLFHPNYFRTLGSVVE